ALAYLPLSTAVFPLVISVLYLLSLLLALFDDDEELPQPARTSANPVVSSNNAFFILIPPYKYWANYTMFQKNAKLISVLDTSNRYYMCKLLKPAKSSYKIIKKKV